MAVITINGREFPAPDIGANFVVATTEKMLWENS